MRYHYTRVQLTYWNGQFHDAYIGRIHEDACGRIERHIHTTDEQLALQKLAKLEKLAGEPAELDVNPFNDEITTLEASFFRAW